MNKIRAGIKNKIIVVLAVACTAYFVSFWMGTERDVALKAYEKAAEEAMIADTEILAHNGHIRSMDGQDTEIRDLYNDKPVLIYFWMPWSDDSKNGMAVLENIYRRYGDDIHVVVLSFGSTAEEARDFYSQHAYSMPFYTGALVVADDYNVYEVPQCVMIRKGGAIADRIVGLPDERSLAYMVEMGMEP